MVVVPADTFNFSFLTRLFFIVTAAAAAGTARVVTFIFTTAAAAIVRVIFVLFGAVLLCLRLGRLELRYQLTTVGDCQQCLWFVILIDLSVGNNIHHVFALDDMTKHNVNTKRWEQVITSNFSHRKHYIPIQVRCWRQSSKILKSKRLR